jgi:hypothetical protein
VISTGNVRDDVGDVLVRKIPANGSHAGIERRVNSLRRKLGLSNSKEWHFNTKYPLARKPPAKFTSNQKRVDFCRGPAEVAEAIRDKRPCRLSSELGLHLTELIEVLQYPERFNGRKSIESRFAPIEPLDWIN